MKYLILLLSTLLSLNLQAQDAFDPFIDYSEFEAANEEEADINFFRNGRFLTLSIPVTQTQFTSSMGNIMKAGTATGLNISYFFDLRFALQITLLNSQHAYSDPEGSTGNLKMNSTLVSAKYFFNMQNVTKGLADWNPYVIAGVSQAYRKLSRSTSNTTGYAQDGGSGFHIGGGVEVPILSNKMFIAVETKYTLISFPDENKPISTNPGAISVEGDLLDFGVALGINF